MVTVSQGRWLTGGRIVQYHMTTEMQNGIVLRGVFRMVDRWSDQKGRGEHMTIR